VTRDELAAKWKDARTDHTADCDIESYDLCTCGLQALQAERRRDEYNIRYAEEAALREKAYQHERRARGLRKVMVLGALVAVSAVPYVAWVTIPVFGLWLAGGSLLWSVEAYMPHGDSRLRGGLGWFKFMFWSP